MGFLGAWHEHLHRRFIGMHHRLIEHDVTQCIDQRLQLHSAAPHPLREGGARDRQASTAKDRLLAVQR